jgi:UDP-GlcNAc:undecaprenyl-phosphate GlcNAc-1-phosphate transferase
MDFGVRISGLTLPVGNRYYQFPIMISQLVTVLWLVGFMNTINLADGLDGLAAGIVMIASGTFFIVCILQKAQTNDLLVARQLQLSGVLSMTLCGASLGFILFNFHPAKVFMGDCGALLLGFLLGSISIIGTLKTTAVISLFVPVIIVALPVFDVILSIYRRLRSGISVGKPDKEHIHHRMLKWGWTHREVVLFTYVITLILSVFTITLTALRG